VGHEDRHAGVVQDVLAHASQQRADPAHAAGAEQDRVVAADAASATISGPGRPRRMRVWTGRPPACGHGRAQDPLRVGVDLRLVGARRDDGARPLRGVLGRVAGDDSVMCSDAASSRPRA